MFQGSMVAIVTPFKGGAVDGEKLGQLVDFHLDAGTDVIVPCGTTGESATLSHEEHEKVIKIVVEAVGGRKKVLAGTGSNNTEEAIRLTQYAKDAGADGALMISPYYNKPTQEGLYQHYAAVTAAVDIPLVLYNVPSRTSVSFAPETVERLSQMPSVVGIKEATGSMKFASEIIRRCGPDFDVISGDDFTVLPLLSVGGVGAISVTANIVPREMHEMIHAYRDGDTGKARELHYKTWPLHEAMFIETNPIPVKAALALMGKISWELRLPMTQISAGGRDRLKQVLAAYGLL